MRRGMRLTSAIILCLTFVIFTFMSVSEAQRLVRVGCFPMSGLQRDEDIPVLSAYEKAYLQELAKYAPWRYEYIYFPNWQDAVQALEDGGVDMIGFAQKTPEREAKFAYSEYAAGITYEAVFAAKGSAYLFEDFAQFQGRRIGVLERYICRQAFQKYMDQNHFAGNLISYRTIPELGKALKDGEIDLVVANLDDRTEWENVVGRFAPSPYFYITNIQNEALLEELNYAEAEVRRRTPEFLLRLNEAYFPKRGRVFLKKRDLDFVKEHPIVTIGLLAHRDPLYYLNASTGKMEGIMIDLLDMIAAHTGLTFQYIPIENTSPMQFLKEKKADIVAGLIASKSNVADGEIKFSETVLQCRIGMIGRRGEAFDPQHELTIAVPKSYKACQEYIANAYPHFKIFLCGDDTVSGLNAVQDGQADFMMQNSYVLSRAMQLPVYRDLTVVPTVSAPEDLKIGILAGGDPRLLSLLNDSIVSISPEKVNQSIVNHMMKNRALSFQEVLRGYKSQIFLGALLVFITAGSGFYIFQMRHRHLHQIERRERILKNITNNITGGVITLVADENFTITYANDGFIDLIGYDKAEYTVNQEQIGLSYIHEDDRKQLLHLLRENHEAEKLEFEFRIVRKDRGIIPALFRGTAARDENGKLFYYCVVIDISLQKGMMHQLEMEKERYRIITEQSDSIIFEIDFITDTIGFSHKFEEQFGIDASGDFSALKTHPDDIAISDEIKKALLCGSPFVKNELRLQKADGSYLWCEVQASPIWENDLVVGAIGKITDVDEAKSEREQLKTLSQTDSLTGLYNKTTTYALIGTYLDGRMHGAGGALIFIDIDNFKGVNDFFGHMKGDEVLSEVADELRRAFRPDDVIGRFGGDEFCVFAPGIHRTVLYDRVEAFRKKVYRTYQEDDKRVQISSSIGIACYPEDADGLADLIRRADEALYAAKERGKNRIVFYETGLVLQGYQGTRD